MLNGFGDAGVIEGLKREIRAGGVKADYNGRGHDAARADRGARRAGDAPGSRVDILVNNAGIQHVAPIEEFPAERWDAVIAINLSSAFTPSAPRCRR